MSGPNFSSMDNVFTEFATPRQDVALGRGGAKAGLSAGVSPASFDELVHDLRQPLSAIEALAYFMEMTAGDESVRRHSQRIQAIVSRAHGILDRSQDGVRSKPSAAV
jgi:signal transduction histidine kinase